MPVGGRHAQALAVQRYATAYTCAVSTATPSSVTVVGDARDLSRHAASVGAKAHAHVLMKETHAQGCVGWGVVDAAGDLMARASWY